MPVITLTRTDMASPSPESIISLLSTQTVVEEPTSTLLDIVSSSIAPGTNDTIAMADAAGTFSFVPFYFVVLAIPGVFIGITIWCWIKEKIDARKEAERAPQHEIELQNLRRHWFPWREALEQDELYPEYRERQARARARDEMTDDAGEGSSRFPCTSVRPSACHEAGAVSAFPSSGTSDIEEEDEEDITASGHAHGHHDVRRGHTDRDDAFYAWASATHAQEQGFHNCRNCGRDGTLVHETISEMMRNNRLGAEAGVEHEDGSDADDSGSDSGSGSENTSIAAATPTATATGVAETEASGAIKRAGH